MNVGVIGLGAMGSGMAASLRRAGHTVCACDAHEDVARAFTTQGGVFCAMPSDVARACSVVVSVVVNAAQTEEVLFGANGAAEAMRPGSVFVMCSTVDPGWSTRMEERLEARGLLYLDAPISGGAARAAKGEITMMTAGRPAAYAKCGDVLKGMAANVYRLGERAGAGSTVKIVNQLLAGVHIAAAAEAMALGIRAGVDPKALFEVITHSAGNELDVREPHAPRARGRLHAALRRRHLREGPRHRAGYRARIEIPAAARIHRAPDVHAGERRGAWAGG